MIWCVSKPHVYLGMFVLYCVGVQLVTQTTQLVLLGFVMLTSAAYQNKNKTNLCIVWTCLTRLHTASTTQEPATGCSVILCSVFNRHLPVI